jgi:hypothetical protein
MKPLLYSALSLCLLLSACEDDDSKATVVDTKGSVAVTLSTMHLNSAKDVMTTHYVVWRYGNKVKEFDVRDTIPSLGLATTEGEDDNGNTEDMVVPKDYDFFITVK